MRRLWAVYAISFRTSSWHSGKPFGFRCESSERTWLYRIAHNVALTWQVRDRRLGRISAKQAALQQILADLSADPHAA